MESAKKENTLFALKSTCLPPTSTCEIPPFTVSNTNLIRKPAPPNSTYETPSLAASANKIAGATHLAVPDDPTEFERDWELEAWKNREDLKKPIQASPENKVLFAIPALKRDGAFRNVIRKTWMHQKGICNANNGHKDGCNLYTIFLYAEPPASNQSRKGSPSDCVKAQDCVTVEAKEGWSHLEAMTVASFRKLLNDFKWATHIGKLDMDTFPHWQSLIPSVPKGQYSIIGNMVDHNWCGGHNWCPPKGCGRPVGGKFSEYWYTLAGPTLIRYPCWSYPQGALYLLSRALALGVFGNATIKGTVDSPDRPDVGLEDFMVGWAAIEYARKANVEVSTWPHDTKVETMFEHLPAQFDKAALDHKVHGAPEAGGKY